MVCALVVLGPDALESIICREGSWAVRARTATSDLLLRRRTAMEHKPRVDLQAIADLEPGRKPSANEPRRAACPLG